MSPIYNEALLRGDGAGVENLDEITKNYYNFNIVKGNAISTANNRCGVVRTLLRKINIINRVEVETYLVKLKECGDSNNYINVLITALRPFFRFCLEKGYTNDQTLLDIKKVRGTPIVKSAMSDEEIEEFLNLAAPDYYHEWEKISWERATLMFKVLAFSGMRPSECTKLKASDGSVDFGRNIFVLYDTKTKQNRLVPIAPNFKEELRSYIKDLKGDVIFPLSPGAWGKQFRKRLAILGMKRVNLTCYSLRHSFASALLSNDANLLDVQMVLGHKSPATTAIYYHLDIKKIQKTISKHPLILKEEDPKTILQRRLETVRSWETEKDPRFAYELKERPDGFDLSVNIKDTGPIKQCCPAPPAPLN